MPFPLLNLPTELRLEIYRHLFGISPTTRLVLYYLPRHLIGCKRPYQTFEILYSALPTPHVTEYQDQSGYPPMNWARQESCSLFLTILVTCKWVYEEAMPLFYSETFFILPGLVRTINWLNGIGAQRRQCIRRLSIEYGVPESRKVIGNDTQDSMQALSERLMDVERVDVLELRIFSKLYTDDPSYIAEYISGSAPGCPALRKPTEPLLLYGIQQLERLPQMGCLQIVGDPESLLRFSKDQAYLKALAEGKKPAGLGKDDGNSPVVKWVRRKGEFLV